MTPGVRPPGPDRNVGRDRDRAQLILVGAVAIAIILMGLVVVFNTVLFTDAKTATNTLDESTQAQAFTQQVKDEVGRIARGLAASDNLTADRLSAEVENWSAVQSLSHAHTGPVFVGIDNASASCTPSPCSLLSNYRVTVTWDAEGFTYNRTVGAPLSAFAESVVYVNDSGNFVHTASDRGVNGEYGNTTASVPGPFDPDLDGDDGMEIAYGTPVDEIKFVNTDTGKDETLINPSSPSVPHTPRTTTTSLAVGSWNGSPTSVFYTNGSSIIRVSSRNSPVEVVDLDSGGSGNGAIGVVGIGDIDGDPGEELVYVDRASEQLRYLDGTGSTSGTNVPDGGVGSSGGGLGAGRLVDFDGDGKKRAVIVDGSNEIKLVSDAESTVTLSLGVTVSKDLVAPVDVDADGSTEIVFKESGAGLRYVDDVLGSPTVEDFAPEEIRPDGGATQ